MSVKNKYKNNFKRKHFVALTKRFMSEDPKTKTEKQVREIHLMLIRNLDPMDGFGLNWVNYLEINGWRKK